jgi:hypothetical protein
MPCHDRENNALLIAELRCITVCAAVSGTAAERGFLRKRMGDIEPTPARCSDPLAVRAGNWLTPADLMFPPSRVWARANSAQP